MQQDKVICIFPEGGSHDQTQLLPLKAGACVFIWQSNTQLQKNPHLVCSGINYFGAHKFRSKVVIKYSNPMKFDIDVSKALNKEYKREKVGDMMVELRENMEEVKFIAPSYNELLDIQVVKDLYLVP